MRYVLMALAVAFVLLVTSGCAGFRSTPTDYSVRGVTATPEEMVREASMARERIIHAETYREMATQGMVYPYEGGYHNTDMGYFYGGQYPVAPYVTPRDGYMSGGAQPITREELEQVRERSDDAHQRATDGLRLHQSHRDYHRGQGR